MKLFRVSIVFALLILLYPPFALKCMADVEDGDFGPYIFPQGVPPLPDEIQPGQKWQGFPQYRILVDWTQIPKWLSGNWTSKEYRILKTYDHREDMLYTLPMSRDTFAADHLGDMQDREGGIWHAMISPEQISYQKGNLIEYVDCIKIKAERVYDLGFDIRQRFYHVMVDPSEQGNPKIVDAYTEERVNEYKPTRPDICTATIYNRYFDSVGAPTHTTNSMRILRRSSPFQHTATRCGVDLTVNFLDHLREIGRDDLVP
ncbi:hypothetical protein KA183_00540 [bacterium]|nr:hypothetical protein [bacterium]QQR57209.1 MAG: hypothetical protein IPG59_19830 [Candidatus Melainabacteria bacterium]